MVDIILYGYDLAPNVQKVLQTLALFKIPYKFVEVPRTLPRPDFTEIGITYRRTPLLSIDSDMYVDTALIIEKLSDIAAHSKLELDTTNHVEFSLLGNAIFPLAVGLLPTHYLQDENFIKDRTELVGRPFNADIFTAARPETVSQFLCHLSLIQKNFLKEGKTFILDGETPSTADIYLYYIINWATRFHGGSKPEVTESSHPLIFKWLDNVRSFLENRKVETKIDWKDAKEILLLPPKHEYAKFVPHIEHNPLKLVPGQAISITPVDTGKTHPQLGKLISLNNDQVCLRNESNLVLHFPRIGYSIKAE